MYSVNPTIEKYSYYSNSKVVFIKPTKNEEKPSYDIVLTSLITAYNSEECQTDSTPFEAAWGDRVRPGMIAVSWDLLDLGFSRGTKVVIKGKTYTILDKMNPRWRNKFDIWHENKEDAVNFGVKRCKVLVKANEFIMTKLVEKYQEVLSWEV